MRISKIDCSAAWWKLELESFTAQELEDLLHFLNANGAAPARAADRPIGGSADSRIHESVDRSPDVPVPEMPERPMAPPPARPVAQPGGPTGVATDPKVIAAVWKLHDQGGLFQREIGKKVGLSQTTVSHILRRPRPAGDVPVPKAPAAPGAVPTNGNGQKIYATSVVEAINRIWRGATDDGISRALGVFTPPQVQRIRSELWTIFELKDQKQPLVEGEKTWSTKSLERRDVVVGRIVKSLQEE